MSIGLDFILIDQWSPELLSYKRRQHGRVGPPTDGVPTPEEVKLYNRLEPDTCTLLGTFLTLLGLQQMNYPF